MVEQEGIGRMMYGMLLLDDLSVSIYGFFLIHRNEICIIPKVIPMTICTKTIT